MLDTSYVNQGNNFQTNDAASGGGASKANSRANPI
jgi:hypothetical protein